MIRAGVCAKVLPLTLCVLWVASKPNAIEGYVAKKGSNATGDNKSVWYVRCDGVNYDAATCEERGVVISGVAPAFLLAPGSMRNPLVCEAHARTIIAPAYAF